MGAQDSLFKAVLAEVVPIERRSTGFGLFDTGFGIAWFLGSAVMGFLYDKSILVLVLFWSNASSGATRESAQPKTMANGCWLSASCGRSGPYS
jgi:hypothetical protein